MDPNFQFLDDGTKTQKIAGNRNQQQYVINFDSHQFSNDQSEINFLADNQRLQILSKQSLELAEQVMILQKENKNLKSKIYGEENQDSNRQFQRDFDSFSNKTHKMSTGKLNEVIGNIQAMAYQS